MCYFDVYVTLLCSFLSIISQGRYDEHGESIPVNNVTKTDLELLSVGSSIVRFIDAGTKSGECM